MKVSVVYNSHPAVPLTTPLPPAPGILVRLLKGDVCDPNWLGNGGSWFSGPAPRFVVRFVARIPVPYVAWRTAGGRGGYVGFKVYGVDSEAYKRFLPAADVYAGSQAMCITARPFADLR